MPLNYLLELLLSIHHFNVDDGLIGADSLEKAMKLQRQLQEFFNYGGFLLRKWKGCNPEALQQLSPNLLDSQVTQTIHNPAGFAKALGIEWSRLLDSFQQTTSKFSCPEVISKRVLVPDVARTFDIHVLGWFDSAICQSQDPAAEVVGVKSRIIQWDEPVPVLIQET